MDILQVPEVGGVEQWKVICLLQGSLMARYVGESALASFLYILTLSWLALS